MTLFAGDHKTSLVKFCNWISHFNVIYFFQFAKSFVSFTWQKETSKTCLIKRTLRHKYLGSSILKNNTHAYIYTNCFSLETGHILYWEQHNFHHQFVSFGYSFIFTLDIARKLSLSASKIHLMKRSSGDNSCAFTSAGKNTRTFINMTS